MYIKSFNNDWYFWREKDAFSLIWDIPENARRIDLPHDAMLESTPSAESRNGGNTGYRDGDVYIYVKRIFIPEEAAQKTLIIKFEGVYMNAFVYVNGQQAGKNVYGYSVFYVALNDYIEYGKENEIRVQVRAGAMTNSRWYSGAGIYRDVWLLESDITYLEPDGVQIRTEYADEEYAVLEVKSEIHNRHFQYQNLVLESVITDDDGNLIATERIPVLLDGGESRICTQRFTVDSPKLWSAETPVLYKIISRLYLEKKQIPKNLKLADWENYQKEVVLLDENEEAFGIRTLRLNRKKGLLVNGVPVKLRGACIHHDSGLLGTATYEYAQYRQIRKLKEAGFNAIRMSHHPMAPAMLRACDRLGMYVMDETFDMWTIFKTSYDYALYYKECWEEDVSTMVRKNYNHPSVILYSVGNEIPEIGNGHGANICDDLCKKIKEMDPTRFTLVSINGIFATGTDITVLLEDIVKRHADENGMDENRQVSGINVNEFMSLQEAYMDEIVTHDMVSRRLETACASVDIAGYNYMTARYEPDGINYPNRIIVGSETYPPEIGRNWTEVKKFNHVIGDFTWTGWDYIGEAGIGIPGYAAGEGGFGAVFPAQLAYCGDYDITGWRRPLSYYREIVFGLRETPYIAVQNPAGYGRELMKTPWVMSDAISSWTWDGYEGKPVKVEVYSSGQEVELFSNGVSLGRKNVGEDLPYRSVFDMVYEPGSLVAITYENGKELGRFELSTASVERELIISVEESLKYASRCMEKFTKDIAKLIYLNVELRDEKDQLVMNDDRKLHVTVQGAERLGFGSANPKSLYHYQEDITETYLGRAQIILKAIEETSSEEKKIIVNVKEIRKDENDEKRNHCQGRTRSIIID